MEPEYRERQPWMVIDENGIMPVFGIRDLRPINSHRSEDD